MTLMPATSLPLDAYCAAVPQARMLVLDRKGGSNDDMTTSRRLGPWFELGPRPSGASSVWRGKGKGKRGNGRTSAGSARAFHLPRLVESAHAERRLW